MRWRGGLLAQISLEWVSVFSGTVGGTGMFEDTAGCCCGVISIGCLSDVAAVGSTSLGGCNSPVFLR